MDGAGTETFSSARAGSADSLTRHRGESTTPTSSSGAAAARDWRSLSLSPRRPCAAPRPPPCCHMSQERIEHLLRRLAWTFPRRCQLRAQALRSLSHEPNKAMNLNSYIGFSAAAMQSRTRRSADALTNRRPADLVVPAADYVLTLDPRQRDSCRSTASRLVLALEQTQDARVGVAQTPYSAYPGAATRLERIAGATTDLSTSSIRA